VPSWPTGAYRGDVVPAPAAAAPQVAGSKMLVWFARTMATIAATMAKMRIVAPATTEAIMATVGLNFLGHRFFPVKTQVPLKH